MYKRIDFDNGLRVILNSMPHMESTSMGIWIAAGSRYEDKNNSGISHFLEHMVFKGTPTRSNRKIKEEIEGRGGALNGFTSEEITCYITRVSSRHIDIALDVLSDMVLKASLKDTDIERERPVIIEEIKMYRDLPPHHIHDVLSELMWPNHSLGLSIAGDVASVGYITRQDLVDYKKKHYIPENMALALCGNLGFTHVIRKIKNIFDTGVEIKPTVAAEFNKLQSRPQVKILYKDTEQTRLCIGLHTFGRMHKDRFALMLLHIILGANMSSRLFENVREKKGLAYDIGTEIKKYKDVGAFIVNAGLDHRKVVETTKIIRDELIKIKEELVPKAELERAKEYFTVQLSLALEDTMDHMLWLGEHIVTTNEIPSKKDIIEKVEDISSRDIQRVAKTIFTASNINLALIGPMRDKEKIKIEKEVAQL
jgi:predicted Zn-dependent peptidase